MRRTSEAVQCRNGNARNNIGVLELAQAGVKRISVGSALARLAFGSMGTAAREMRTKGTFHFSEDAIGFAELESFSASSHED